MTRAGANLCRFFVLLAAVVLAIVAVPNGRADNETESLLNASLNDLVAWDAGFGTFEAEHESERPHGYGYDLVIGSQRVTQPVTGDFQQIRIVAFSRSDGAYPGGQVWVAYRSPAFPGGAADLRADVVCLNMFEPGYIVPPTAFTWARLRRPFMGYTYLQIQIRDNGNPLSFTGQSPDEVLWLFSSTQPGPDCGAWGTSLTGDSRGNFIVHNSP
jgi:hypothetical protein